MNLVRSLHFSIVQILCLKIARSLAVPPFRSAAFRSARNRDEDLSRHRDSRLARGLLFQALEAGSEDASESPASKSSDQRTRDLVEQLDGAFSYEGRMPGGTAGRDYRCGFVSVLGAANQGKSTIVNALVGENLCATAPRPQTTRHAILGLLTTDSAQVCLIDTPGILDSPPAYKLQEGMMEAVVGAFRDADVLLVVTDLFSTPIPDDALFRRVQASRKPKVVCVNKIDLADKVNRKNGGAQNNPHDKTVTVEQAVALWRHLLPDAVAILPMSAGVGGANDPGVRVLGRVLAGGPDVPAAIRDMGRPIPGMFLPGVQFVTDDQARALLPRGPPLYDSEALTDRPERFVASETIRSALFESLRKELPYCCEVRVVEFKEPAESDPSPVIRIRADIVVERDSQKVIVIGKGGEQIKKIGSLAREKLEDFFQSKVSLVLLLREGGRRDICV
jgi:GTP-binding protein Era